MTGARSGVARRVLVALPLALATVTGCSRAPKVDADGDAGGSRPPLGLSGALDAADAGGASSCTVAGGPPCHRFATVADAFRWVLAREPAILAVGEAHAQKGTEAIASATRRFTETLLPLVARRASDVVVELWAPEPRCMKAVEQVASAQRPVALAQAETNQNEYVTLGTKAKEAGMTPWLLRPTCDDFATLADAGADDIGAMLGLVKRLTQAKVTQLYQRNQDAADGGGSSARTVVAYGGALHNNLAPAESTRAYSFGPELDRLTGGRYVELDLIVPEYVRKDPSWEKLPWYASFEAQGAFSHQGARGARPLRTEPMVFVLGPRSFTLIFPASHVDDAGGPSERGR